MSVSAYIRRLNAPHRGLDRWTAGVPRYGRDMAGLCERPVERAQGPRSFSFNQNPGFKP